MKAAIAVFVAVLFVGAVDIASTLRAEHLVSTLERQVRAEREARWAQVAALESRAAALELRLSTLDMLARETYGTLTRHRGHALPVVEREQPTPRFR